MEWTFTQSCSIVKLLWENLIPFLISFYSVCVLSDILSTTTSHTNFLNIIAVFSKVARSHVRWQWTKNVIYSFIPVDIATW